MRINLPADSSTFSHKFQTKGPNTSKATTLSPISFGGSLSFSKVKARLYTVHTFIVSKATLGIWTEFSVRSLHWISMSEFHFGSYHFTLDTALHFIST
jgi:hypothetical protein